MAALTPTVKFRLQMEIPGVAPRLGKRSVDFSAGWVVLQVALDIEAVRE